MGGPTESIFNHLVCRADLRPENVDIRGEDHKKGEGEAREKHCSSVALRLEKSWDMIRAVSFSIQTISAFVLFYTQT